MTHDNSQRDDRLGYVLAVLIVIVSITIILMVNVSNQADAETECNKAYYFCGLSVPYGSNGSNTQTSTVLLNCDLPQAYGQVSCIQNNEDLYLVDSDRFVTFDKQQSKTLDTINFIKKYGGTHLDSLEFYLD